MTEPKDLPSIGLNQRIEERTYRRLHDTRSQQLLVNLIEAAFKRADKILAGEYDDKATD